MFSNSNTMYKLASATVTSYNWIMDGCLRSFRRDISRMAVDGTPSDSLQQTTLNHYYWWNFIQITKKKYPYFSKRIRFNATILPVSISIALKTTPYVPETIYTNSSNSYRIYWIVSFDIYLRQFFQSAGNCLHYTSFVYGRWTIHQEFSIITKIQYKYCVFRPNIVDQ